jgi:hypothetical protein
MSWLKRAPKATITKMTRAELIDYYTAEKARFQKEGGIGAEINLPIINRELARLQAEK